MTEFAPVGVRLPTCRCARCLGAYTIAQVAQAPAPEPPLPGGALPPAPRQRGRLDPSVRASQILTEELGGRL